MGGIFALGPFIFGLGPQIYDSYTDRISQEKAEKEMQINLEWEKLQEVKYAEQNWEQAFSNLVQNLEVLNFPQADKIACPDKCSSFALRKFYGNEVDPSITTKYKSNVNDLIQSTIQLSAKAHALGIAFVDADFLQAKTDAKNLNEAIDDSLTPDPNLSLGEKLGFTVNGSQDSWRKFFTETPSLYLKYTQDIKNIHSYYCSEFKPKIESLEKEKQYIYEGMLSDAEQIYKSPLYTPIYDCSRNIAATAYVQGTPDYILTKI
jgi:hypothetical protein